MPTVAWINGHAFAGGLMFAMYHDYRIFNPSRGFLCLNELDMGAPLKPPMSSIFRQKVAPATYRSLVLEAKRFPGPQALEAGLVDGLGALPEVVAFVEERKLAAKPKSGIYGLLKREMYRESLQYLETYEVGEARDLKTYEAEEKRETEGKKRVAEWKKNSTKSKL
jgi:enoyl-CoA hydratase/carnithine racemase